MKNIHLLADYERTSTRKREVMSASTVQALRCYLPSIDEAVGEATHMQAVQRIHHALLARDIAVSTRRTVAGAVGSFYVFAGILTRDERKELVSLYQPEDSTWSDKALDASQIYNLFTYLYGRRKVGVSGARNAYMITIMYLLGLRRDQVILLGPSDVTVDGDYIRYEVTIQKRKQRGKTTKSLRRDTRLMSFGPSLGELHDNYMAARERLFPNGGFFQCSVVATLSRAAMRSLFHTLSMRIGAHITPHMLRHTAGTRIANTVGMAQAAAVLGHANIQTTQRYVRLADADESADIVDRSLDKALQPETAPVLTYIPARTA